MFHFPLKTVSSKPFHLGLNISLSENAASGTSDGDPLPVPLAFHQRCGSRAAVIGSDMRTAHRPHAMEDFNNGVVLSNRILLPDEMFEVSCSFITD